MEEIKQNNLAKFNVLKSFNLPVEEYAITASGPLGIRGIREIGDVDIIVTPKLWLDLVEKYGVKDENGVKKIAFPNKDVEALGEGSFYTSTEDLDAPSVEERIKNAEIIEGLPFESLEHVIYYKRRMGRDKDLKDIMLIEEWKKSQPNSLLS